jgi:hypothetical protein
MKFERENLEAQKFGDSTEQKANPIDDVRKDIEETRQDIARWEMQMENSLTELEVLGAKQSADADIRRVSINKFVEERRVDIQSALVGIRVLEKDIDVIGTTDDEVDIEKGTKTLH